MTPIETAEGRGRSTLPRFDSNCVESTKEACEKALGEPELGKYSTVGKAMGGDRSAFIGTGTGNSWRLRFAPGWRIQLPRFVYNPNTRSQEIFVCEEP